MSGPLIFHFSFFILHFSFFIPMSTLLFTNGTIVLEDRVLAEGQVEVHMGRIRAIGVAHGETSDPVTRIIDLEKGYLMPGFVDIHVHGGAGADFMDGTAEAVRTVCRAHARCGTTTIFPTTTTGSPAQIEAMLQACAEVKKAA